MKRRREFRSLQDQYYEFFLARKTLDPDSLAFARSVFEKLQIFSFQPDWRFCFVITHKIYSIELRILHKKTNTLTARFGHNFFLRRRSEKVATPTHAYFLLKIDFASLRAFRLSNLANLFSKKDSAVY